MNIKKIWKAGAIILLVIICGFFISKNTAYAATYYTATNGNDSRTCAQATSTSTPRQTISAGVQCLSAGDTLLVRGGTYDEHVTATPSGTSWSNPVRIANYPGETVWLIPTQQNYTGYVISLGANERYVEFSGINIDATVRPGGANRWCGGGVRVEIWSGGNAHHIRYKDATINGPRDGVVDTDPLHGCDGIAVYLQDSLSSGGIGGNEMINLTIHGGGDSGEFAYCFYINSDDNIIDNVDCYDMGEDGMQIYSYYGNDPSRNIVRNNKFHDIRPSADGRIAGFIISGSYNKVYNNIVYNIPNAGGSTDGISVWGGSANAGNEIYNNTVYNVQGYGIHLDNNTAGTTVKNNISYGNNTDFFNDAPGTTCSNNLFGSGSISSCATPITGNPLFVNAGAGNFKLNSGSPAIKKGAPMSLFNTDLTGAARTSPYDLGTYEFAGVVTPPPPPTPPTPPPPPAPASSWYKLDETSGTSATDSSGGLTGALQNGPVWAAGKIGGGLSLDGIDDGVQIPGVLGSPQSLTLSGWANLTARDTDGASMVTLGDYAGLRLDDFQGKATGFYYDGTTWNATGLTAAYAGTGWHHFAYTIDGANHVQNFYVDGINRATTSFSTPISYSGLGTDTFIGKHAAGSTTYDFKGTIDEVRIYNRALSSTEVQTLAAVPLVTTISASPITIAQGSTTTVTWTNIASPMPYDWFAIFKSGSSTETNWLNLYCTQGTPGATGKASGSCSFALPATTPAGVYDLKLLANNTYTALATTTLTVSMRGDLNVDHIVNSLDWSAMNAKWFTTDANTDLNKDSVVNAIDFSLMNTNWLKTW